MKLIPSFTVTCCNFSFSARYEHDALTKLMGHIRKCHPALVKKLNQKGREHAMGQNGCGYYDCGKGTTGGWFEAQPSFREAHKLSALKYMLNNSFND